MTTSKISSFQLISILICTKLTFILTSLLFYKAPYNLAEIITIIFGNVITLLIYLILKKTEYNYQKKLLNSVFMIFAILAVFCVTFIAISSFKAVNTNFNIYIMILLFIIASIYAASRGIEGISRISVFVVFIFLIIFIFILLSFIPNNIYFNLNEFSLKFSPIVIFINTGFIELFIFFMLKTKLKNPNKPNFYIYILASIIISILIVVFVYGILGKTGITYSFPFFSASAVSKSGFIRRLDSFLYCFYMMIALISSSSIVYIITLLFSKKKEELPSKN